MTNFHPKIGLEVHVQLRTQSKMFCRCANDNEAKELNSLVCPVCLGYPGTLPVLNGQAVAQGAKAACLVGATVAPISQFDRKNYFYPDLPKGYQISQYFQPLATEGRLELVGTDGAKKTVRIQRLHLEEDTAKLTHSGKISAVDYNRAGIPLLEIVSYPDIDDFWQAPAYLKALHEMLVRGKISAGRMQLGEMRCDANISILSEDGEQLGEVVEIKNLNSFKNVERALRFEFDRQAAAIDHGEKIIKETRGWNMAKGETFSQRTKEKVHDYRYFPEPDLSPVEISPEQLAVWQKELPRNLAEVVADLVELGVTADVAKRLSGSLTTEEYFVKLREDISKLSAMPPIEQWQNNLANLVVEELAPRILQHKIELSAVEKYLTKLVPVLADYLQTKINNIAVKEAMDKILSGENSWQAPTISESVYDEAVRAVMEANADKVQEYQQGKIQLLGFFIGQVQYRLEKKGDAETIKKMLQERLR
jgi:aspartyl-tRNA(Asn)/glutamyl-tRNA(Gln) amidotransferase subunit B